MAKGAAKFKIGAHYEGRKSNQGKRCREGGKKVVGGDLTRNYPKKGNLISCVWGFDV